MRKLKIGLIGGDGIGKEVVDATKRILEKFTNFEYVNLEAGWYINFIIIF